MDLNVKTREKFGKSVKALRKQGLIPAELYGRGIQNLHLAIDGKEFRKIWKEAGENTVLDLLMDREKQSAIIHDIQRDYVSGEIIHVDFHRIRMDEKIQAHIPLEFTGEAPAVKEQGGILNKTISEIMVESLPGDLPHRIVVNLELLKELNQSIYVKDLDVPKNVKIMVDAETAVATVTPPLKEEAVAPPVEVGEVKVEAEEKKAEREEEAAAEGEESKKSI